MFVIMNKVGRERFYLSEIDKTVSSSVWTLDNIGKVVLKKGKASVRSDTERPNVQYTYSYFPEISKAVKYKTREKAEEVIRENPGLHFCKVEEI